MPFEIKDEFKEERVGFNDSAKPLGERDDLHLLAEMALKRDGTVKDKHVINYFKTVPTLEEIKAVKEKGFNQKQETKGTSTQQNTANSAGK